MGFNDEMDFDLDEIRKMLKEKDEVPEEVSGEAEDTAEAAVPARPRRQEKRAPRRVGKREAVSKAPEAPKGAPAKRRTVEEEALLENQRDAKEEQEPKGYELFTVLRDVVNMLAVVTLVFVFFLRLVSVSGSSMYPTFVNTDWLVLQSNFLYKDVERGDIVVLSVDAPELSGPIVKRVIATGGQTVDIDFETGTLYVDGKIQVESYIYEPTYLNEGLSFPLTVPENSLFVMGDNRNHSLDSRSVSIGCVGTDRVLGKALFILIPGRQTNETGTVTGKRDFSRIGAAS